MDLIKKLFLGASIATMSLTANAQNLNNTEFKNYEKFKKTFEKEYGIYHFFDLRDLGNGYVMEWNGNNFTDKQFNQLRFIDAVNNGNCKIKNNGHREAYFGKLNSIISEKTLKEVDNLKKDKFVSPKEISKAYENLLHNAFIDYATKTLSEKKENINLTEDGYAYATSSENLLRLLTGIFESQSFFSGDRKDLHRLISKDDKVLTNEELRKATKIFYELLFGENKK